MSQNGQYKLKDYPRKRGGERGGKKKERTFVSSISCLGNLYEWRPLRIRIPASSDSKSMQLRDTSSHIIIFKIRISHCQIHLGPVLRHTLYKFIVLGSLGQETVQFGLGSQNRNPIFKYISFYFIYFPYLNTFHSNLFIHFYHIMIYSCNFISLDHSHSEWYMLYVGKILA